MSRGGPAFRCSGCGEVDSIVEVSLVPRVMDVDPTEVSATPDEEPDIEYRDDADDVFWEDETVLGYGCRNADCSYWHGQYGISRASDGSFTVTTAPTLAAIAVTERPVAA